MAKKKQVQREVKEEVVIEEPVQQIVVPEPPKGPILRKAKGVDRETLLKLQAEGRLVNIDASGEITYKEG